MDVLDPYRWLEDDKSEKTKDWVNRQNQTTNAYLSKIPYRDEWKIDWKKLWNYEKISAPFNEGQYTYFSKMMDFKINR